jgi:hypothetical protein
VDGFILMSWLDGDCVEVEMIESSRCLMNIPPQNQRKLNLLYTSSPSETIHLFFYFLKIYSLCRVTSITPAKFILQGSLTILLQYVRK